MDEPWIKEPAAMNEDESGKKSAGLAPVRNRAILRAVVGAYLIYLGVSLLRDHLGGKSSMAPWFAWVIGIFFAVIHFVHVYGNLR